MPIPDAGQLAAEIRNGNTMLAAGTPSLQAARHIAIFLQVHEMLHVLLETQLTPDAFHLWLNEGLAEYFAWRTAEVHAPDALPGFLDDRLSELSKLPPDGTIDFLAWSAADSEMLRRLALPDGEVITFGWSNGRRVNEIRRAADVARAAAGQFDGDRAEQLRRDAQLWDEWVQTVETAGGPGHHRTRWGVYAGLLALFLEMDAAGLDPRSLIDSLRNTAYARLETRRDMDAAGEFHEINGLMLTATNDRILALLPDVDGVPAADLVRRYPVARARQVLEAQRSRLMAQARP